MKSELEDGLALLPCPASPPTLFEAFYNYDACCVDYVAVADCASLILPSELVAPAAVLLQL